MKAFFLINLIWSGTLLAATMRLYFIARDLENKFRKWNRWIAEQERKQRML